LYADIALGEQIVNQIGVDFHAGKGVLERHRTDIGQSSGRCADENEFAVEQLFGNALHEHVVIGDVAKRLKRALIIDQHAAFFVDGNVQRFPLRPPHDHLLIGNHGHILRSGVHRPHHHGQGEGKILAAGEIEEQRHGADHAVVVRGEIGKTDAAGRMVKRDQLAVHAIRCLENAADLRRHLCGQTFCIESFWRRVHGVEERVRIGHGERHRMIDDA